MDGFANHPTNEVEKVQVVSSDIRPYAAPARAMVGGAVPFFWCGLFIQIWQISGKGQEEKQFFFEKGAGFFVAP